MRITDILKNNTLIRNIDRQQEEMEQIQNQLSTGKRINKPSDNPAGAAGQMYYNTRVSELDQFESNAASAKDRLDHIDGRLKSTTEIMQRIRVLTVQAANGIYQGDDGFEMRKVISTEIDQHLRSLIEIANSSDAVGKPLFGGHVIEKQPFQIVTANIPGLNGVEIPDQIVNVQYRGDNGKRLAELERSQYLDTSIPGNQLFWGTNMTITSGVDGSTYVARSDQRFKIDGVEFHIAAGDTVDDIIDKVNNANLNVRASKIGQDNLSLHTTNPHEIWLEDVESGTVLQSLGLISSEKSNPPNNYSDTAHVSGMSIFDVVIKLRNDLYNADQLEIGGRDLANLDSAMENILKHHADVGARQNRLEQHEKRIAWDKTYMTEMLAKTEGIDFPETIMNMKWLETVNQYALNVGSRIIRPTLLDFLR